MKEYGFTLVEMLIALMIISILILLIVPAIFNLMEQQEINDFFNTLDADVLYIQNEALGTRKNVQIIFHKDYYMLIHASEKKEVIRDYPAHLTHDMNGQILFSNSGTVMQPTTLRFKGKNKTYKMIFPLGKGRHYIEEQ